MTTLFESETIKIYMNPAGEVFVCNKIAKTTIRIGDTYEGFIVTAGNGDGKFEPWSVNGLPAFRVHL